MPAPARGAGRPPGQLPSADAPATPDTASPEPNAAPTGSAARPRGRTLELLLRFVSCGLLALLLTVAWRVTLAPASLGAASALAGVLSLLVGFIIGGLLWYARDVRLRSRAPERVDDERLVYSFVVFAVTPFAVLVLVGIVWVAAVAIGAS